MNTQFKLIGFDLDGTLVDSLPDLTLSVNQSLGHFGLPEAPKELVLTWIGNGADKLIGRALTWASAQSGKTLDENQQAELRKLFNHYYGENICNLSRLYPNVVQTLQTLKARGYLLAVVTNKPSQHVRPVLRAFGIEDFFDEVLGAHDLPQKKPHPAPLYYLCGKFGLYPKQILFVGDSKNDILVAHAAGAAAAGLTYGYNYNIPISESQPDWVIDEFNQLLNIAR